VFARSLAAMAPVAVIGGLLFPAAQVASAQRGATAWDAFKEYYYNEDIMPHINPSEYGYLPKAYEQPWLYLKPLDRENSILTGFPAVPERQRLPYGGYYRDGYEDDNWYYDFYHSRPPVDSSKIKWYDW